jgi:putative Mn2+ efflux pump MntP
MILALQVSHFTAAFTFAFFVSVVFGITQRNNPRDMLRYGAYCFAVFIVGMFAAGWVMWLLHH